MLNQQHRNHFRGTNTYRDDGGTVSGEVSLNKDKNNKSYKNSQAVIRWAAFKNLENIWYIKGGDQDGCNDS